MITQEKRRRKGEMPKISQSDAAYMAGFMDGEGHFSIACGGCRVPWVRTRQWKTKAGVQKSRRIEAPFNNYTVRVGCANTDKRVIDWIQCHIGGTYSIHRHKTANWKDCYKWHLYGANVQEQFILAVLPYLILKREQANIVLQFIRLNGIENPSKREELHRKVLLLNRRGTSPTTNTQNTEQVKIESGLHGDMQSVPQVTAVS